MARRVLMIDDDASFCELAAESLKDQGFDVTWYTGSAEALASLQSGDFDVVLTDIDLQTSSGLELCAELSDNYPEMPVVVMTSFGSMDSAIGAIRAGAYDFATKPLALDALSIVLERAGSQRRLRAELARLRERPTRTELPNLIGNSPAMTRVAALVSRIATGDTSVLIVGDSGTGKELVAKAIHEQSGRKGPFLAVNCAAIPETLLESELFGHARGAFTDAHGARTGLFVAANGGTLLLDEIGDMPFAMQAKLLRALQERHVRPLGTSSEVPFDVRIIAATNRDLESEVEEKRFRGDLYYRINVLRVMVPPLRARGHDVLLLAQHFLLRAAARSGKEVRSMSPGVAERLLGYDWPGNVRELENCIERAVAFAHYDELTTQDLPPEISEQVVPMIFPGAEQPSELPTMQTVESRYIESTLTAVGGNKTRAAKILGVSRRTFDRKRARVSPTTDTPAPGAGQEPEPAN